MLRANLVFFFSGKAKGGWHHEPCPPLAIAPDRFGVCVASSEDSACDDYVVARLKELGLRCVRVDYGYDSPGSHVERFAKRLANEGFQVVLHLVAPRQEVESLVDAEGAKRWRQFLRDTFGRFSGGVSSCKTSRYGLWKANGARRRPSAARRCHRAGAVDHLLRGDAPRRRAG